MVPLEMAREVAEQLRLPMMVHIDHPPPTLQQVLERLRPGDVLTHCFRPFPNTPVGPDDRPHDFVVAARERGVLFDIGHGMGSLSFEVAREMLATGFPPDTISSDVHALCVDGGSISATPVLAKSVLFRVASVMPRESVIAAISASKSSIGRPSRCRSATMRANSRAAALTNGRMRPANSSSTRSAAVSRSRLRLPSGRMAIPKRISASDNRVVEGLPPPVSAPAIPTWKCLLIEVSRPRSNADHSTDRVPWPTSASSASRWSSHWRLTRLTRCGLRAGVPECGRRLWR
jgi:hypothetical protein